LATGARPCAFAPATAGLKTTITLPSLRRRVMVFASGLGISLFEHETFALLVGWVYGSEDAARLF
jgi:hypothetical protein